MRDNVEVIAMVTDEANDACCRNLAARAYTTWLIAEAAAVNPHFQALVAAHADRLGTGAVHKTAPLKGEARMLAKKGDYEQSTAAAAKALQWWEMNQPSEESDMRGERNKGTNSEWASAGGMCDIVRASIAFDSAEGLLTSARTWLGSTLEADGVEVIRVKNPFHESFEAPAGAYRDVKLNLLVRVPGAEERLHICELQLILCSYLDVKKYMHLIYKILRGDYFGC